MGLLFANRFRTSRLQGDGDCWHIQENYAYPPATGIIIHPDDWRWKEGEHHAWREHPGRGYWRGGEWAPF